MFKCRKDGVLHSICHIIFVFQIAFCCFIQRYFMIFNQLDKCFGITFLCPLYQQHVHRYPSSLSDVFFFTPIRLTKTGFGCKKEKASHFFIPQTGYIFRNSPGKTACLPVTGALALQLSPHSSYMALSGKFWQAPARKSWFPLL